MALSNSLEGDLAMKATFNLNVTLFALFLLLPSASLQAQQCSTRTTFGRYLVRCDGYLTPAPNAPQLPAKTLATATSDRNGNFLGSGTVSVGGVTVTQTLSGTEQINSDCTGTITYSQTINGQPGPPINITFVVSEGGDKIDGLVTDAGNTFACKLTRIARRHEE
jgi:hypothetical protein